MRTQNRLNPNQPSESSNQTLCRSIRANNQIIMLGIVLCVLMVLCYLFKFYSNLKKYPPGPTPLPLIGNLHQLNLAKPQETLAKWGKIYGPIYTVHFPTPNVVIAGAKELREALVKNADSFSGRPHTPLIQALSGSNGIIFSDGHNWSSRRRFALRTLRDLGIGTKAIELKILRQAEVLADVFRGILQGPGVLPAPHYIYQPAQAHSESGEPIDPCEQIKVTVANIIAEVTFGRLIDNETMLQLKKETCPWITKIPLFGYFHHKPLTACIDGMHELIEKEIDITRSMSKEKRNGEIDQSDNFIERYLKQMNSEWDQNGENLTFHLEDLMCTATELMLAGIETTATTVTWAMIYLAQNKDVQRRCREELLQATRDDGRKLEMSLKNHVPYFVATIHEIQRLGNIVPINVQHRVTKQVTIGEGHSLPAGTAVIPQISSVLGDGDLFPQPGVFKPDRFLADENANCLDENLSAEFLSEDKYAEMEKVPGQEQNNVQNVTPFALGKRACPGEALARAELFLILAKLLSEFDISMHTEPKNMDGLMWATRQAFPYMISVKALE